MAFEILRALMGASKRLQKTLIGLRAFAAFNVLISHLRASKVRGLRSFIQRL